MIAANTAGMTLGHGIFIRADHKNDQRLLAHEHRHVTQYECSGSVATFMSHYVRELLHYSYGKGPFEIDAEIAERPFAG